MSGFNPGSFGYSNPNLNLGAPGIVPTQQPTQQPQQPQQMAAMGPQQKAMVQEFMRRKLAQKQMSQQPGQNYVGGDAGMAGFGSPDMGAGGLGSMTNAANTNANMNASAGPSSYNAANASIANMMQGGHVTPEMMRVLQQQSMQRTASGNALGHHTSSPQLGHGRPAMPMGQQYQSSPQILQQQLPLPFNNSMSQNPSLNAGINPSLATDPAARERALQQAVKQRLSQMTPQQQAQLQQQSEEHRKRFMAHVRATTAKSLGFTTGTGAVGMQGQTAAAGGSGLQGMGMRGMQRAHSNGDNSGMGLGISHQLNSQLAQQPAQGQGGMGMQQFQNFLGQTSSPASNALSLPGSNMPSSTNTNLNHFGTPNMGPGGMLTQNAPMAGSSPMNFAQSLPDLGLDFSQQGFTSNSNPAPSMPQASSMQRTASSNSNTGLNAFGFSPATFSTALPGSMAGNNAFGFSQPDQASMNATSSSNAGNAGSGMMPFTQAFDPTGVFTSVNPKAASTSPQKDAGSIDAVSAPGAAGKAKGKAKGKGKAAAAEEDDGEGEGEGSKPAPAPKPKRGGKKGAAAAAAAAAAGTPGAESVADSPAADSPLTADSPAKPKPAPRKRKRPTAAEKASKKAAAAAALSAEQGDAGSGENSGAPSGADTGAAASPAAAKSSTPPVPLREGIVAQWQQKAEAEAKVAAAAAAVESSTASSTKEAADATSAASGSTLAAAAGQKPKGQDAAKEKGVEKEAAEKEKEPIHVTFKGIPHGAADPARKLHTGGAAGPGSLIGADQPRKGEEKRVGETKTSTRGILRQDCKYLGSHTGRVR